jgi:hypothetical protein
VPATVPSVTQIPLVVKKTVLNDMIAPQFLARRPVCWPYVTKIDGEIGESDQK